MLHTDCYLCLMVIRLYVTGNRCELKIELELILSRLKWNGI